MHLAADLAKGQIIAGGFSMENILVWLLIFAGGAIALLGVFLAASERELKKKRLEIKHLSSTIGENPTASGTLANDDFENAPVLRLVNDERQSEVSNLSAKVELSQKESMELQGAARRDQDSLAELQHLRKANEALISEVVDLKARLETSHGRVQEAMTQQADAAERERQLHNEMVDLRKQLELHQQKLHELAESREKLANIESLATLGADERRQLEAKMAALEHELERTRQGIGEADVLRARLADLERQREALREENRKHEQAVRRWQERSAEGDENRQRLSALRAPFDVLLARHAELAAHHNQFEEDLATFGGLMAMRGSAPMDNIILPSKADAVTAMPPNPATAFALPTMNPAVNATHENREESPSASVPTEQLAADNEPGTSKKRRLGLASLVLIVSIAAALAYSMLNSASERTKNAKPVVTSALPVEPPPNPTEETTPARMDKEEAPAQSASIPKKITPKKKETAPKEKTLPAAQSDARVNGIYEVTQTSRVYAAPTETSQLLGDVEPGVKVNVVSAQDGWLEIHSKRGRPPGFIRKEAARAAKN